jgi:putative transposase
LLNVSIQPADVQDRDGARDLLRTARRLFPFVECIFADAGYQGPKMAKAVADTGCWTLQIVKRSDAHRFVVLPKRWIVERTFAWIMPAGTRCSRWSGLRGMMTPMHPILILAHRQPSQGQGTARMERLKGMGSFPERLQRRPYRHL